MGLRIQGILQRTVCEYRCEEMIRASSRRELVSWAYHCAHRALLRCPQASTEKRPAELLELALSCAKRQSTKQELRVLLKPIQEMFAALQTEATPTKPFIKWRTALRSVILVAQTALSGSPSDARESTKHALICAEQIDEETFWQREALRDVTRKDKHSESRPLFMPGG